MGSRAKTVEQSFWEKVLPIMDDRGCWEWTGGHNVVSGYATMYKPNSRRNEGVTKTLYGHRVSWELHNGLIPDGLTIDHLCRNRGCVNPRHLEAVSQRVNNLRAFTPAALNAKKTVCQRGHQFYNRLDRPGTRECAECSRIRARAYYAANRKKILESKRVRHYAAFAQNARQSGCGMNPPTHAPVGGVSG